jgi:RNA polymerase sigma-70 factor (ECF subfamily)
LQLVDVDLDLKPSSNNPETAMYQDETRNKVHKAIANLPLKLRQVLVLRVYEEWSYARIAEVLDIPVGTVMSRLSRAREALKEELESLL